MFVEKFGPSKNKDKNLFFRPIGVGSYELKSWCRLDKRWGASLEGDLSFFYCLVELGDFPRWLESHIYSLPITTANQRRFSGDSADDLKTGKKGEDL